MDGTNSDGGVPDGPVLDAGLIDSANPSCDDGQRNQGEGDTDCGGPCATKCTPNQHCGSETDCTTGACVETFCTLASGPPFWVGATGLPSFVGPMGAGGARDTIWAVRGSRTAYWTGGSWVENPSGDGTMTIEIPTSNNGIVGDGTHLWSLGGRDSDGARVDRALGLLPAAIEWTDLADLGVARMYIGAAMGPDGKVYAIGGALDAEDPASAYSAAVESYTPPPVDAASQAWDQAPPDLPFGAYSVAAASTGGALYAIGGQAFTGELATTLRWAPGDASWTAMSPLPVPRTRARAVGASDGRLYLAGGHDGDNYLTGVLAYVPAIDHWFPVPPLTDARADFGLTVGPDGRIWAVGGIGASTLGTVEIYGPELEIDPVDGPAGTAIQIGGSNFAANATVSVHIDTLESAAVGTASTSAAGGMQTPVVYTVPVGTPVGTRIVIHAIDNRSLFPVRRVFTVE